MAYNRTHDWLTRLPKVDLHLHLDGSVKPETILEIALDQGIDLPVYNKEGLIPHMRVGDECGSLIEYLSKFDFTTRFMQSGEALERIAYEVAQQSAEHNCKYVEVRFAPQLHRNNGLTVEETIHYVVEGMKRGQRDFGVKAGVIAICMRNHSCESNLEVIRAAAKFVGKGVVAVDLAGDEASYPPEWFREVFAESGRLGIPVTIHAGEAAGAVNVYEAVTNLGAVRIGHGVRLKEDTDILELVKDRRIPLEMCPISNIQTKAVSGWEAYPIREYLEQGLLVTINTDNPSVSGTDITNEYRVLSDRFGFTEPELVRLVMNGVEAAFMDESDKLLLRREMEAEINSLGMGLLS
ncbi:adenosine deaminase [Paenibacillus chondroitinus]|uniref:Adenosine deaminase n=1 Tax=Paenibacillus chondroitinus TaxID=59842 RepID=A0ABU6DPI5_9BACL|nr:MULTISPECIES: adenosine deaminase [Paenibacillus]MCY9657453.1 adenosine deaminase [Paenibacillus anseongense]MEB4798707.1 adenosine deaminase [Paenibacillus chondroitinus]